MGVAQRKNGEDGIGLWVMSTGAEACWCENWRVWPPRNPRQETAIAVQFVPGMRFLVFDFGV
eukprot:748632-Rhodomonas_salina.2